MAALSEDATITSALQPSVEGSTNERSAATTSCDSEVTASVAGGSKSSHQNEVQDKMQTVLMTEVPTKTLEARSLPSEFPERKVGNDLSTKPTSFASPNLETASSERNLMVDGTRLLQGLLADTSCDLVATPPALTGELDSVSVAELVVASATKLEKPTQQSLAEERFLPTLAPSNGAPSFATLEPRHQAVPSVPNVGGTKKKEATRGVESEDSTWPSEVLELNQRGSELTLRLNLSRSRVSAEELREVLSPAVAAQVRSRLREMQPRATSHYLNVDVSSNHLDAAGAGVLVWFLRKLHNEEPAVYVHALRAHRNKLGNEGAHYVAELVLSQVKPVMELHLSHNGIGAVGAATIILAIGASHQAYPFRLPMRSTHFGACWVRMEHNDVEAPDTLLDLMKELKDSAHFVKSEWSQRDWGPHRSPNWATNAKVTPQAILHMFSDQTGAG